MLVGRDQELELLSDLLASVHSSGGKVALVRGEAGVGKSSLIREFAAANAARAHVVSGWCDDLKTPQPLGPFWDIARDDPLVASALESGDRRSVWEAVLELLSRPGDPSVVVVEDTHWADEATLDAIKYLGRRIARANGLLLLTYRDGEVDWDHPLRAVIGELPPQVLTRIQLDRLSTEAVASLVDGTGLDVGEVMALTGGNPLFVTEVIAVGLERVPSSVQDSVLARAAKLSVEARSLLDLVAVMPGGAGRRVVDAVIDTTDEHVAECARQGLLEVDVDLLSFHHELSRRAIESALTGVDRRRLNRMVLTALGDSADWSQLVHHAVESGAVESASPSATTSS